MSNMCSIGQIVQEPIGGGSGPGAVSLERLEGEITQLAGHINAASCRWLLLVGEFDRREGWARWGCRSCAQWLSYRCGLSPAAGREQLRVARLLAGLPEIRAAFGRGELCYSQVRALTRIATAETERDLLMIARHATAGQLEVIVRAYRGVLGYELGPRDPAGGRRFVRLDHDDDGSLLIRARLPAEEGALVAAALEAGRDAIRDGRAPRCGDEEGRAAATDETPDPKDAEPATGSASAETTRIGDGPARNRGAGGAGDPDHWDGEPPPGDRVAVSNADALVLMAQTLLAAGPADRAPADDYQVVVHVDAATLAGHHNNHNRNDDQHDHDDHGHHDDTDTATGRGSRPCQLDHGAALHPETARRLACDASLVRILERDGRPLSVGRKTRAVSPALRRVLQSRDPVCRFPGCLQRRYLHAHHIDHWANGGPTDLSNLLRLCSHHHRLLHEGGYTIKRGPRGALRFHRPDGIALPTTLPPISGQLGELQRANTDHGLDLTDRTCRPHVYPDRLDLHWIVDNLAETDGRLSGVGS
jgi:hypothetical protein